MSLLQEFILPKSGMSIQILTERCFEYSPVGKIGLRLSTLKGVSAANCRRGTCDGCYYIGQPVRCVLLVAEEALPIIQRDYPELLI